MIKNLPTCWRITGYGFDSDYDVVEFELPFVFTSLAAANEYADRFKRVADKLSGFYSDRLSKDHAGELELSMEAYDIYDDRAEYWHTRKNRLVIIEVEVR